MAKPLPLRTIIGYGIASVADSGTYNFVLAYFLFFLTNVSMVAPEQAGAISLIAIVGNGLFTILVGFFSDRTHSPWGRRLPYLLASIFPLFISLCFMFSPVAAGGWLRFGFYTAFALVFWAAFALYYIPYSALGAELTDDYHQRTRLRNWARIFGITGNLVGTALPLALVGFLSGQLMLGEGVAWRIAAALVALSAALSIVLTLLFTWRRVPGAGKTAEKGSLWGILREYRELISLRPYHYILWAIVFFTLGSTLFSADLLYFTKYVLGLNEGVVASLYLWMSLFSIALTPLASLVAARLGKSKGLGAMMLLSGGLLLISWLAGISSYMMVAFHMLFFAVGYSSFWQIINSIAYDISEVDEFVYNRRREGSIISLNTVLVMLMPGAAIQLLGLILDVSGYNPYQAEQGASALTGIVLALTLLPALLFAATGIVLLRYPLSRQRFDLLKQAIAARAKGDTFSTAGLEEIIKASPQKQII